MIDYISLARRIQPYRVKRDEDMPAPYRIGARSLSDDWPFWPFTRISRRARAYRLPMPALQLEGNMPETWVPFPDESYPLAPWAKTEVRDWYDGTKTVRVRHLLTVHPVPSRAGQWSLQGVCLDGQAVPCYITWKKRLFGRVLTHNRGLRPEPSPDVCWWFPEFAGPH